MRHKHAVAIALTFCLCLLVGISSAHARPGAMESITKNGVIRCGYNIWPPFFNKDTQTAAYSGISYDYMEALAAGLGIKVEWVEEVAYADIPTALNSARIDAFCAPIAATSTRIMTTYFTDPIVYAPLLPYVRVGDARFDGGSVARINSPDVTISIMEGEAMDVVATRIFPLAKKELITAMQGSGQLIMNVVNKKADIVFIDKATADSYIAGNPGKIAPVVLDKPIGVFPVGLAVTFGDDQLLNVLNAATRDLENLGILDTIFAKYKLSPEEFRRPVIPYK